MAATRCLHLIDSKRRSSDGMHLIRLNVGGARMMVQVCPVCHSEMAVGGTVVCLFNNSGRKRNRELRRFPGDVKPVWFEVQVI